MSIQAANRSFLAKIEQAFHDVNGRLAREIRRIDLLAKNDSVFARLFDLVLSASGALLFALVSGGYLAIRIRKSKKCKDCQSEKAE